MKLNVLVTDGNYQNTNAIIRALKSMQLKVGVICNSFTDLNFVSTLPDKKFFIHTNLLKSNDERGFALYWNELEKILKEHSIEVFMPVGNISFRFASIYKEKIEQYCKIPIVDFEIMQIAQDKKLTFQLAEKLEIPAPKTFYIQEVSDIYSVCDEIDYPCVIKKTRYNEGGVLYCNTKEELIDSFNKIIGDKKNINEYPIIQEYVIGKGTGYYAIFKEGICKGFFMHERIHEFPVTGGASTLAKSTFYEDLKHLGDKILSELKWNGVAMVEFKRKSDNSLRLMEINPKFWGSLELSFAAGINFPYMNYLLALKKEIPYSDYKKDLYFRWTIPGDILWYFHSDKKSRKKFMELKKSASIINNIHWDDPLVIIHNLLHLIIKLLKTKKYPHGFIKQKN